MVHKIGNSVGVSTTGYVTRLLVVDVGLVTMIAAVGRTCSKVEVQENSDLYELQLRPRSCLYSEANFEDGDGNGVDVKFQFGDKDTNAELYDWLWANQNRRWVALFETVRGEKYIVGEVRNGLQAVFSKGAGSLGVSLKARLSKPALKVTTLDPDVLFLHSEFVPADFSENDFLI